MKKEYSKPELEVQYLVLDEIITVSDGLSGLIDGGTDGSGQNVNFGDIVRP